MTFTLQTIAIALAEHLAPQLLNTSFYVGPNQQGTAVPALFLRQTNARIAKKMGNRFLRKLGLDPVYLVQPNAVDTDTQLQAAADVMDENLDIFPYDGVFLRTYDRRWEITGGALHYKFDLNLWLTKSEDTVLMQSIQELNLEARSARKSPRFHGGGG